MEITCRTLGLQELQRRLETIKNLDRDPRVDRALGRGASMMQGQVKLLTPTGNPGTGYLKNSIINNHVKMMEYSVETNCEYAIYVEFGTGKLGDPSVPHTSKDSWTYYSDALHRFVTTHGQEPAAMFRQGFQAAKDQVYVYVKRQVEEIIANG